MDKANSLGIEILVAPHIYNLIGKGIAVEEEDFFSQSHIVISLGGDGTLLHAACKAAQYNKPIMGINMGNLGFLTDTDVIHAEDALIALKENAILQKKE